MRILSRGARFSVQRRVSTRRAGLAPAEAGAGTLKRAPRTLACMALCCVPALAAGGAKIAKHLLLFDPSGGRMTVSETYLIANSGKTAWNDPNNGALRFYLPAEAQGQARATATPPGGSPVEAPLVKTSKPDVLAVNFAMQPGETRIDLNYAVPYAEGSSYQGRIVTRDENTYLIAPNGVTLKGDHLNDLGLEPQSQAHIYGLEGTVYKIELSVAGDAGASDGAPIEEVLPHAAGYRTPILSLALGILAVGFAILYRKPAIEERNERGRH